MVRQRNNSSPPLLMLLQHVSVIVIVVVTNCGCRGNHELWCASCCVCILIKQLMVRQRVCSVAAKGSALSLKLTTHLCLVAWQEWWSYTFIGQRVFAPLCSIN
jgi:hypothetical protein